MEGLGPGLARRARRRREQTDEEGEEHGARDAPRIHVGARARATVCATHGTIYQIYFRFI
jgi:hypothetical protein